MSNNSKTFIFCLFTSIIHIVATSYIFGPNSLLNVLGLVYINVGGLLYLDNIDNYQNKALINILLWPLNMWILYDKRLQEDMSGQYNVYMNDIQVGTLTENEYAHIKRTALRTPFLYFQQCLNIVSILYHQLGLVLRVVPLYSFWIIMYFLYADPMSMSNLLNTLLTNPMLISNAITTYTGLVFSILFLNIFMYYLAIQCVPGFENKFKLYIQLEIRRKLRVSAIGELVLTKPLVFNIA